MKTAFRRSRRHRNPRNQEKKQEPFFSPSSETKVQTKEDSAFFQPKLTVGSPGDKYEKEADDTAAAVVNSNARAGGVQRKEVAGVQRYMTNADKDERGTNTERIEKDKEIQEKPEVQSMHEDKEKPEANMKEEEKKELEANMKEEEEQPDAGMKEEEKKELEANMKEEEEQPDAGMKEEEEQAPEANMKEEEKKEPEANMKEEEEQPDAGMKEEEEQAPEASMKEEEKKEPEANMKEDGGGPAVIRRKKNSSNRSINARLSNRIKHAAGRGKPLPAKTKAEMEAGFKVDFSDVNIHTDQESVEMNRQLGAQAFTHGKDIYFNAGKFHPQTSSGRELLAHELTHVIQQQGRKPIGKSGGSNHKTNKGNSNNVESNLVSRRGLLSTAQEQAAVAYNRRRFDRRSVSLIEIIVGIGKKDRNARMNATLVEAIAAYQDSKGLTSDGKVGEATIRVMTADSVAKGDFENPIQLIVDFYNLDLSDTLSIRYDSSVGKVGIAFAQTTFDPGGLRTIRLGDLAYISSDILYATIKNELRTPAPTPATPGALPTLLSGTQETKAIQYNRRKYKDKRSVLAIQGVVGAEIDGSFGKKTVERIAAFQAGKGLTKDGKVGVKTLEKIVDHLQTVGGHNAAIRLIMDYFNMPDYNNVLDIHYDPNLTGKNADTVSYIPGPVIIKIGPDSFAKKFPGLVHTIRHELEHSRQNKLGIDNEPLSEFLGEAIEILSIGMPEEEIAGFFNDADRAIENWKAMEKNDKIKFWKKFVKVRKKVQDRYALATPAEQATHKTIMDNFNGQTKPSP